jgi:galactokinase
MHRRVIVPARVNIIGEHTDYAQGLALPFAINRYLVLTIKGRETGYSGDETVIALWQAVGGQPADLTVSSEIAQGKGMSSSAAICLAIVIGKYGNIDSFDACKKAQTLEHEILKTPCGLLDQMAMMFAKSQHCTMIDFSTMGVEYHDLPTNWIFKLVDSTVHRKLSEMNYNANNDYLSQHVTSENQRVRQAIGAKPETLGKLLNQSHNSLKQLGVSTPEVDNLVENLQQTDGVLGARMMGGGFGGMILVLVENEETLPNYSPVVSSRAPLLEELG